MKYGYGLVVSVLHTNRTSDRDTDTNTMNSIPENEKGKEVELVTVNTSSSGNEHDADSQSWTDEEEKQLLKKLDCTFLPALWMMSLISHLDRSKYIPQVNPLDKISY